MKIAMSVFLGLIIGINVYAIDVPKCEPIESGQFVSKTLRTISHSEFEVEFYIKGESIGKDIVKCMHLINGSHCRGNNLSCRILLDDQESIVVNHKDGSCYSFYENRNK